MTTRDDRPGDAGGLRQRAEALARERATRAPEAPTTLSPEELERTLHELRVHQIELEMQNEELRRAQAEIEASRARYFDLYDLAPVGYFTLSEHGLILEANLTLATLLGLARGALVQQPVSRFILGEDQDIYYLHRKRLVETDEPQECELRLLRPDGSSFWAHLMATATRAEDGAPLCRVMISDVTERKRMEDAVAASEEKHRVLFTRSRDALMILAPPSWRFTAGNPSAFEMFGVPDEGDFISRAPWEYSPAAQPDGRPSADTAKEMIQTAMATGSHFFEWTYQRLGGGPFPATVLLTRIEIGGQACLQATVRDITADKEAQAERERLHAAIAQSDRLSTMGTLAAGIAHEINNPLSYVLFNIESLSEDVPKLAEVMRRCHAALCARVGAEAVNGLLGPEVQAYSPALFDDVVARFRDALAGTIRIKEIARRLGTFSRVERSEAAPVDVHLAAEQAINMAFNQIRYRARLIKDFGPVPMVLGSDGRLAQVFLNLLINAAHAIDEGHVEQNEIRIRTWAEGDQVFAEVSDTGKGVAPEHQVRLFEPFFTTKGVGVGTGIGLSICKKIVEGFGGNISFTSEEGRGTCFLIRLPRLADGWEVQGRDGLEPGRARPRLKGRILVVDDEAGIRGTIVRMLGREHEVIAVASGKEAQVLLQTDRRFDLIFCDLMMPEMTGMELHAWLAQCEPRLAEQVVFITGGAFTPGASEYLGKVGNLRVDKPFDTVAFKKIADEFVLAARAKLQG